MQNNRKLKAFYVTVGVMFVIVLTAIIKGVSFTGDNVIAILAIFATLGGGFFGANVGEHFAKKTSQPKK